MRSIIGNLGSESFARIRIGIGHHTGPSGADYVLSRFTEEEEKVLAKVLEAVSKALVLTMRRGIRQAMNEFNALDFSMQEPNAENS
jgi:PTH1 family peptidyl-tRNA hydrolase